MKRRWQGRISFSILLMFTGLIPVVGQIPPRQPFEAEDAEARSRAAEWFFQQRAYPGDRVPAGYRFAALDVLERTGRPWPRRAALAPGVTGRWNELGPDNVGGRTLALAVAPGRDNIVYAGLADGGVFKTTDGGLTWVGLNDGLPSLAVKSLVLDPTNPNIVYAGTGEGYFNIDAAIGQGVMKSTDGGATWTFSTPFAQYVNRLAIDPRAPATLFAATRTGVFKTTDANATWRLVFSGHNCIDLTLDPENPQTVVIAVWDRAANQTENGIWRTTDGGATWARVSAGLPRGDLSGRAALARSPSNPRILYAGIAQPNTSLPVMGIWKSADGGATWNQIAGTPSYCGSQCWYDSELTVHPANPDIVFAGGLFLWKTVDGGVTWARSDTGVHVDHHSLAFGGSNRDVIYSGNDGGVFRSTDGGTTWSAMNYGLGGTQFYALAVSPTDPSITYGGTQDNGTQKGSGAGGFQQVLGGDGMVPLVDPTDPMFVYAESQNGGLARSTNGGISFTGARTGIVAADRFNWVTPWVLDPTNPQVLYAGSHRLYKSTNRAASWAILSDDLTRGAGTVSAIAVAPSDGKVLYAGTSDGLVWTATDGGATLGSFRRIATGLPNRYVTRLGVHPTNPRIVYATFSGFNNAGGFAGHVFRSADGGESWTNMSSGLPDIPVQAIVIDPRSSSTLFLGTDLGCFRSLDEGRSWEPFNEGLPNVVVDDLAFVGHTGMLRVASHGRGMWQYTTGGRSAAKVAAIGGDNQRAAAGEEIAFPVRVAVFDAGGAPVPDAIVTFQAPAAEPTGAFVSGGNRAEVQTDLYGVAVLPRFRLGAPGTFTIGATAAGAASSASISITSVTTAPQLTSVSPREAVAGQVTASGQSVSLKGSGFASGFTVYFVQNGAWYATTTNNFFFDVTEIYTPIPSGLAPGKATVLVFSGGEFSRGVDIDITRISTAPDVLEVTPLAPSPGQQFTASLRGQLFFQERFTLRQGSASYSALGDVVLFGGAVFTMPAHPFVPGAATLEFKNHNSSAATPLQFAIPAGPAAAVLLAPPARAPEQLLLLSTGFTGGFASVPQLNVVQFSQAGRTFEMPATGFSSTSLLVPVPAGLSIGSATIAVRSTFGNGRATSRAVNFTVAAPAAVPAPALSPATVAPSASVTATATTMGTFNTNLRRNRITVRAGGVDYPAMVDSVNLLGTILTFTVPQGVPAGAATATIVSDFGDSSVTRLAAAPLTIARRRNITIVSGDLQAADAGQPFAVPLAVRVTEADGTGVSGISVTFAAPSSGTSGFFENGGAATTSVVTSVTGLATSTTFKATRTGGAYVVRATVAGQPAEAQFRLRNRNAAESSELRLAENGALSSETSGADRGLRSGYVTVAAATAPVAAFSIFGLRDDDGNLMSEAGVADATPSLSGLVFVDARDSTFTGIALLNDNASGTFASVRLFDAGGVQVGDTVSLFLQPRAQTSRLFQEIFRDLPRGFVGTASITSQFPVAAVALRAVVNDRGETIYSAVPVALGSSSPATGGEISFPQLAVGGGYRSSILLLNPTLSPMTGKIRLFDSSGAAAGFGSAASVSTYTIAPGGHFLLTMTGAAGAALATGYAVAAADAGSPTPSGTLLLGSTSGATLLAETAMGGVRPLSRALLYVDTVSRTLSFGTESRYTGLAVVNRGSATANVRLLLRGGKSDVLGIPVTLELGPGKQTARFVDELLGSAAAGVAGTLEVSSDRPVEIVTLRGTVGARGEFLYSTLPVSDYSASLSKLLFAHFADGGGYSSQTVVLNPSENTKSATVRYFGTDGKATAVDLRK
jgi:photosystem II stability/assembly factor-like uncharacterized protein